MLVGKISIVNEALKSSVKKDREVTSISSTAKLALDQVVSSFMVHWRLA